MYSTMIKGLYDEYSELINFCRDNNQVSFEMYINNTYKKALLLSAASYFETVITKAIHNYAVSASNNDPKLISLIDNKALNRQYHTLFNWKENNSNQFWGTFGESTKIKAKKEIKDQGLTDAEIAFMEIGRERNNLVHRNYVEAVVNYTFEEIYNKYIDACKFVEFAINSFYL